MVYLRLGRSEGNVVAVEVADQISRAMDMDS